MADSRVDSAYAALARGIVRARWAVIAVAVLALGGLAAGLGQVTVDTSNESFLHDDDPVLKRYHAFEEAWGRNDRIAVGVAAQDVFDPAVVAQLGELTAALRERVPHLASLDSLVNANDVRADGDNLVVEDLLGRPVPSDPGVLQDKRAAALAEPAINGLLVNGDATTTVATIELKPYKAAGGAASGAEAGFGDGADAGFGGELGGGNRAPVTNQDVAEALSVVRAVVAAHSDGPAELYVAGSPAVLETLKARMKADMGRYMGLSLVIAVVALAALFRRVSAVVLPIATVLGVVAAILGLHGHLGIALTLPMAIAPSFLLAVGVATSVHLLAQFYRGLDSDGLSRAAALEQAFARAGAPMTMAALTTAAGIAAFAVSDLAPMTQLGSFVPLGVVLLLGLSLTLLPALLVALPVKAKPVGRHAATGLDRRLGALGAWAVRRHRRILAATLALLVAAGAGLASLDYGHNPMSWLPADNPARQATERLDSALAGSVALGVVVDTGEADGLKNAALLQDLDAAARELESGGAAGVPVGKAMGLPTVVKQTHQVLNQDRAEAYRIPDSDRLVAQELLLFETAAPGELGDLADPNYRQARFTVQLPWRDAQAYLAAQEAIEARFVQAAGERAEVSVSGVMTLFTGAITATMASTATSYALAAGVIAVLMMVLVRSVPLGLVAMIPNLAPIALVMGAMGPLGIPLDLFTMLVGTIALGLAVDDTMHFLHHYRATRSQGLSVEAAVRATLATMGRPILMTSLVLAAAFAVFLFGSLHNLVQLGALTASAVLLALVANLLLTPALMTALAPKESRKEVSHAG